MRRWIAGLLLAFALGVPGHAAIRGEEISYQDGGVVMKGYLAYDDSIKTPRPGILVVHEWWGHNAHARERARALAGLGYTALAVDMFGDGKTADHPKAAGELSGAVRKNLPAMQSRFNAAYKVLASHRTVDASRIGGIGYCFGGSVVLEMARHGANLAGVAAFHASLTTGSPAAPGKVRAEVLVLNGAEDPFVKPDTIEAFKKEMDSARVKYRFINYPGAVHSFTNPDATANGKKFKLPLAYNAEVDKQSWAEMRNFFSRVFGKK